MKFLTREEIQEKAPAVASTQAASNVSDKYVHVPTMDLVDDMAKFRLAGI